MKISKLFHWLYASIMLMPIFAIGTKCLYVALNKNAKESYYGETINETTYDRLFSFENMISGNDYYYSNPYIDVTGARYETIINVSNFEVLSNNMSLIEGVHVTQLRFYIYDNNAEYLRINNLSNYTFSLGQNSYQFKFTFLNGMNLDKNSNLCYMFAIEYNDYSYLDNVFYYAVDEIKDQPIFSWANNSFINQPMTYIGGLFGLQNNSAIYTLLSFWLSISIIWLTFDLLMYVPLLVHRWIDKGILE